MNAKEWFKSLGYKRCTEVEQGSMEFAYEEGYKAGLERAMNIARDMELETWVKVGNPMMKEPSHLICNAIRKELEARQ